ncbi:MAG: hypothetical protein HYV95_01625 [Opitutae bacterium]|nr:hypothetical protein [Opitutae bacterium]
MPFDLMPSCAAWWPILLGGLAFPIVADAATEDRRTSELIARLRADPANLRCEQAFASELDSPSQVQPPAGLVVVLVPGFGYRSLAGNGADLARPAQALREMGLQVETAPLREASPVEENATLLTEYLRQHPARQLWLVSASSGGPTAAEAISRLTARGEAGRIICWVNIGGLLHGTPLADHALRWPVSWLARSLFFVRGWKFATIASLTTARSRTRAAAWQHPESLQALNLVGIPQPDEVSARARDGYRKLRDLGPNDGLTLIEDALAKNAPTLVMTGCDHFLLAPDIGRRTQAIARLLLAGTRPDAVPTNRTAEIGP